MHTLCMFLPSKKEQNNCSVVPLMKGIEQENLTSHFLTLLFEFSNLKNIYYCGQESLKRSGVALIVNKNPKGSNWVQSQMCQHDLCLFPRQNIP